MANPAIVAAERFPQRHARSQHNMGFNIDLQGAIETRPGKQPRQPPSALPPRNQGAAPLPLPERDPFPRRLEDRDDRLLPSELPGPDEPM